MNIMIIQFKIKHATFCICSVLVPKSNLEVVVKVTPGSNSRKSFAQTYLGTMQTFKYGIYGQWDTFWTITITVRHYLGCSAYRQPLLRKSVNSQR